MLENKWINNNWIIKDLSGFSFKNNLKITFYKRKKIKKEKRLKKKKSLFNKVLGKRYPFLHKSHILQLGLIFDDPQIIEEIIKLIYFLFFSNKDTGTYKDPDTDADANTDTDTDTDTDTYIGTDTNTNTDTDTHTNTDTDTDADADIDTDTDTDTYAYTYTCTCT